MQIKNQEQFEELYIRVFMLAHFDPQRKPVLIIVYRWELWGPERQESFAVSSFSD